VTFTKIIPALICILLLSACGGGSSGPQAPQNAVVLNSTNATTYAQLATGFVDAGLTIVGTEASTIPVKQALDTVIGQAFDKNRQTSNVVAGVIASEGCSGGGSTSFDSTDEYDAVSGNTTTTGTLTFNSCVELGMTISGSFSTSSVYNATTGDYDDNGSGSITVAFDGFSFSMAMDYAQTGNTSNSNTSTDLAFSISSTQFEGFLVETTQPLIGDGFQISSGEMIVTGGAGTKLRLTFNSNSITVELDEGSGYQSHTVLYL